MNNNNHIEQEMARAIAEMHEQMEKDNAEYARKFRIASVFLANRIIDDLSGAKRRINLKQTVGSYISNQKKATERAMDNKLQYMREVVDFLNKTDDNYFTDEETSKEAKATLGMLVDYFRGDSSQLKLAKISNDIEDFRISNINPSISFVDVVFTSMEVTHPDIFTKESLIK